MNYVITVTFRNATGVAEGMYCSMNAITGGGMR